MYFDGIKVGDTVYRIETAYTVRFIFNSHFQVGLPGVAELISVTMDGWDIDRPGQTWFWQPVKIEPPPRPKRKVSKVFQKFVTDVLLEGLRQNNVDNMHLYGDSGGGSPNPVTVTIEYEE